MNEFENNSNESIKRPLQPHRTKPQAKIFVVVIFLLVVAGMFTFATLKKTEIQEEVIADTQEQPSAEVKYASITRVDAKHYYIDGVHTLAGEIAMPTPCDLLEVNALVMESYPEQIAIDFDVINNAQFCDQIITAQRFKVSAPASSEATFSAKFMGREVDLNLIPAGEGETPEDFELFLKG